MALSEQLNKFKLHQERCQTTPSSIAAYQSSVSKPKVTPGFQPMNAPFAPVKAFQPIKFSDDTDRLQRINFEEEFRCLFFFYQKLPFLL
jgi:transcription initiation factor TFIIE subunit beta